MEAAGSSEMLVYVYPTAWGHIPEDRRFITHCCQYPRSHKLLMFVCEVTYHVITSKNLEACNGGIILVLTSFYLLSFVTVWLLF
jgi:hypothetical protein